MDAMADHACSPDVAVQSHATPPRLSDEGGRTVVWLGGENDLATSGALADALAAGMSADLADVVVDLRRVTFLDAATIGVLVRGRNMLDSEGRRLTLRSPSRPAGRMLALCELTVLVEAAGRMLALCELTVLVEPSRNAERCRHPDQDRRRRRS